MKAKESLNMEVKQLLQNINPDWCVTEHQFDIAKNRHYESLFTLGTGYMSTRGSIEEGFENDDQAMEYNRLPGVVTLETVPSAKSKWGTYMQMVGANHPFLKVGMVNLPHYLGLKVKADGRDLNLENSKITEYKRWLDLKTATLYRTFVWETILGKKIRILFRRFMDPQEKFVCLQECHIEMLSGTANITMTSSVDNDVRTNGYDKFVYTFIDDIDGKIIYSDVTTNMNTNIVTASRMIADKSNKYSIKKEDRQIGASCSFVLKENEKSTIKKVSAVITDEHFSKNELLNIAVDLVNQHIQIGLDKLLDKHVREWEKYWQTSDIQIEAQDSDGYNSQLAIRFAIYHLLRARAADDRGQICPKCTSSDVYFGGTFWDMEIFILPFYLYVQPDIAKNTPLFRYRNLSEARLLANKQGYNGARFPWTSAFNGTEECPMWEFAEHQVHITADVALGIWHYYQVTDDSEFLYNYGAEVLIETARYWTERVDKIPGREGYQIYGVMGPDEYKPLTNNNAYTNYLVKFNLNIAADTITMMEREAPEKLNNLTDRILLKKEEVENFREIAAGIDLPIDEKRQIIWQSEDFDTIFAPLDIDKKWRDKTKPFGIFVSQEKRFRSKCMKQSDTVVLLSLFPTKFSLEQRESTFKYYEDINTHDSSNSMCVRMIAAANIGLKELAYECWLASIDIDFGKRPRAYDGLHGANIGGMWQEVVFGFAGVVSALNSDILTFLPCIPDQINKISFKINWKRQWIQVTVTPNKLEIENLSDDDLQFKVTSNDYNVSARKKIQVDY